MSHVASPLRPALGGIAPCPTGSRSIVPSRPFASVEVHAHPRAVIDDWSALAAAAGSPYQSPGWVLPWIETVGAASGVTPFVVVARDADGRAVALLPLGLHRRGGLTVASFLGAKDSNFNMGLFAPGPSWTADAIRALLLDSAAGGSGIDLFALRNQPLAWEGTANPLAALPQQPSPSFAYKATLEPDADAFLRGRLSRDTRKKVRQKLNRLRALGPVSLAEARTRGEAADLLDAFTTQRRLRNVASGIPTDELAGLRGFLDRTVGGDGPVTLYGLRCGERIVATLAGTRAQNRFCGMLTSFDADPEIARTSPGELLLSEVIKVHCAAGYTTFDLGVGEARYKESYCPEVEPLFDSLVGVTPRGRAFAWAEAGRLHVKRTIKQSSWAWPLAQRLRRLR
jgi:CelD/BcsL family acetyltransferase involved in cellulose biosynthesis